MAWENLPENYTDAAWQGLKRYRMINNEDGTVSFQDVTVYTNRENSFFGAAEANRMNGALNQLMSLAESGAFSLNVENGPGSPAIYPVFIGRWYANDSKNVCNLVVSYTDPTGTERKVSGADMDAPDVKMILVHPIQNTISISCNYEVEANGNGLSKYLMYSKSIENIGPAEKDMWKFKVTGAGIILLRGQTCLTGDTLVTMADGTEMRIDQISVGDEILSFDWETMELVPNRVVYTDKDEGKTHVQYDEWLFEDGTLIKTVHRHEFYNVEAKRMKYMDEWGIGAHAYNKKGEYVALVAHRTVEETVRHYKITLEHGTNYFANGLLTGDRYCPKGIEL